MKCSILCFYEISFSCLKSHLFLCEFQEREPSSLNWIFYLSQHVMSIWKNIIQSVLGWTPYFNTTNSFTKHHVQSNKSFVKFLMNCNDQNCIRWFCYWMDPQLIGSTHCSPSIFFFWYCYFIKKFFASDAHKSLTMIWSLGLVICWRIFMTLLWFLHII